MNMAFWIVLGVAFGVLIGLLLCVAAAFAPLNGGKWELPDDGYREHLADEEPIKSKEGER